MSGLPPPLARMVRLGLVGSGATAIVSAIVGAVAAVQLLEKSDEQSLNITRHEVVLWYAALFLAGVLLVWLGARRRR